MRVSPDNVEAVAARFGLNDRNPAAVRKRVEMLERVLEGMFVIPGTNQRVGLDVLLDFLPGGTIVGAAMGAYLAWEARNLGMSRLAVLRMAGNIGFDAILGIIPFIGAVPDFFFKSNTRNLKIIKKHLDKHHPGTVTLEG
jgi:Domain of unknown function (DUF4112)